MSALFGVYDERVCKDILYRIFLGMVCAEKQVPFSAGGKWVNEPIALLETVSMTTHLSLSHRGSKIKDLSTFSEFVFTESIPDEECIDEFLQCFRIDSEASLSLDVGVSFERKHYIRNPECPTGTHQKFPFLQFSSHKSRGAISEAHYLVPFDDPLLTQRYFSLAYRNSSRVTEDEQRVIDAGPGLRLGGENQSTTHTLWRSVDKVPFNNKELKKAASVLAESLYPEFSHYPSTDPTVLLNKLRQIEREGGLGLLSEH